MYRTCLFEDGRALTPGLGLDGDGVLQVRQRVAHTCAAEAAITVMYSTRVERSTGMSSHMYMHTVGQII